MMNIVNFDNDVCALTDTGLVRPHNEDSNQVARTNNGDLFVVCDGMGGHVGGATASKIGVNSICQYVMEHECTIPQQFLVKAFEYANGNIFKESRSYPELKGMGTTACVALVRGDKVWYAHVGDSRIYYFNFKNKALYRLTKDHSVVQALVDQGIITEVEAEHHPEKNKIRKSLGIKETVEPEPCQMPLMPSDGDILLICSDGLSGMMDDDDMLKVLSSTPDVNEAGQRLMELAKVGGGTDNITVQIVRFSGVGKRDAIFDAKNKGVTLLPQNKNNGKSKSNISSWALILGSIVLLIIAGLLYSSDIPKSETDMPQDSAVSIITKDKYLEEITDDMSFEDFNYKGNKEIPCRLYKRAPGQGDVIVNLVTKDYFIGDFTKIDEKGGYYEIYDSSIKKYNRDGSEKESN